MVARFQPDKGQPAAQVLLVENCPATSSFIRQALDRVGLRVTVAASGEHAMELAAQERFDLILLDLSSPGLLAIEVGRALRKENATRNTPMVFLAGRETDRTVVDEARRLDAADVITRPLRILDFLPRVLASLHSQARPDADVMNWAVNR